MGENILNHISAKGWMSEYIKNSYNSITKYMFFNNNLKMYRGLENISQKMF